MRVPAIVRWPGKVKAGAESDAVFATLDFLPTFATLTGFDVPKDRPIDGVDQTDLLLGKSAEGARETYIYMAHASRKKNLYGVNGIRVGKWKYLKAEHIVHGFAVDTEREKVEELYDLEADISETTNLAAKHPELVKQLREQMLKWWGEAGQAGGLTGR